MMEIRYVVLFVRYADGCVGGGVASMMEVLLYDANEVPVGKDMTMNTATSGASGTNLKGAYGTNYFNAVFGNEAWDKLKNSYKYMNI